MEVSSQTPEGILTEEVERLLDDVAPNEADAAALYVETPESFLRQESDERAFGIPGAGFATLVGPVIVSFVVMIAKSFIEHVVKKGTETAATSFLARLMRVFKSKQAPEPELPRKEKTLVAITTALIEAGWDAGRAGEAAEKIWQSGVNTGQRLATVA